MVNYDKPWLQAYKRAAKGLPISWLGHIDAANHAPFARAGRVLLFYNVGLGSDFSRQGVPVAMPPRLLRDGIGGWGTLGNSVMGYCRSLIVSRTCVPVGLLVLLEHVPPPQRPAFLAVVNTAMLRAYRTKGPAVLAALEAMEQAYALGVDGELADTLEDGDLAWAFAGSRPFHIPF